jgi:hypothetical protein
MSRTDYSQWEFAPNGSIRAQAGGGGLLVEGVPKTLTADQALTLAKYLSEAAQLAGGGRVGASPVSNVSDLASMVRNRSQGDSPPVNVTGAEAADVAKLGSLVRETEPAARPTTAAAAPRKNKKRS